MEMLKKRDFVYRESFTALTIAVSLFLASFAFLYVGGIDKKITGYVSYTPEWCDSNPCSRYFSGDSEGSYDQCVSEGRFDQEACYYCLVTYTCYGVADVSQDPRGESSGESGSGSGSETTTETTQPTSSEVSASSSYASVSSSTLQYAQDVTSNVVNTISDTISMMSGASGSSFVPSISSSSSSTSTSSNTPSTSIQEPSLVPSTSSSSNSCPTLFCQKNNLVLAQQKINAAESAVKSQLVASEFLFNKYKGNDVISNDYQTIKSALDQIQIIKSQIDIQLSFVVGQSFIIAQDKAKQQIIAEQKDIAAKDYYLKYSSYIPPSKKSPNDCDVPVDYILFNDVLPSGNLIDSGVICEPKKLPVSPVPINPSHPGQNNPFNTVEPPLSSGSSGGSSGGGHSKGYAFFLEDPNSWSDEGAHEAVTISIRPNGVMSLAFLLAPSHAALEQKISDFAELLLFGSSDSESPESLGFSSNVIYSNERGKEIPYFLWIILVFLFATFFLAVRMVPMKNDNEIYNISSKFEFSKNLFNFGGHGTSIEKMIRDALTESSNNKSVALARLPIITEAYKKLDKSSKEKIAPLYEELVYTLGRN